MSDSSPTHSDMSHPRPFRNARPLIVALSILVLASCRSPESSRQNIVLVTINSLRADRLAGPPPSPDPLPNLRDLVSRGVARRLFASSSETLPSLATVFTGSSPGRHGVMVEGLDRLPSDLPTLASLLGAAGYRTAGFPSLASQGLSSGLSRGFHTYGWPSSDYVGGGSQVDTDGMGWIQSAGRRTGEATVSDALAWVERHRDGTFFVWIHLSEASPPYASHQSMIGSFPGSAYDAALAYEDRIVKTIVDRLASLELMGSTALIVTGDHGESLGAHGESLHGLNLYPPALETAAVIVSPKASAQTQAHVAPAPDRPGRLVDLHAAILSFAGLDPAQGGREARVEAPALSAEHPLFAATLGPRSAFGWPGRIALIDGDRIWSGPEEEDLSPVDEAKGRPEGQDSSDDTRSAAMRRDALSRAGSLASRLAGRRETPPRDRRGRVIQLMRSAAAARQARDREAEKAALREAWSTDPGNFQVGMHLVGSGEVAGKREVDGVVKEIEIRGAGLPEALLAIARIRDIANDPAGSIESLKRAGAAGGVGALVEAALALSRERRHEEAAELLAPVTEASADPDLQRTLGDLYFALQNTYRAGQAYDKAAGLRPHDPDILLRQGDCLMAARDYPGAIAKYEGALAARPGSKLVEMRLGNVALQRGDRTAAIEHFRRGVDVDTNTVAGALLLARQLTERGMIDEAMPFFLDAASRETRSGAALYFAAEGLAAAGRLEEAESYLKQSLEREPKNPAAIYQLARLVVHRGDPDEGGRLLGQLAKVARPELAMMALRDQAFSSAAPGSSLRKGLEDLRRSLETQPRPAARGPDGSTPPNSHSGTP